MTAPVHRLKKQEIVWLNTHYCKHRMPYLTHYSCYQKERPESWRVGFFDIETSHLKANFGFMIGYCILDDETGRIYSAQVRRADLLDYTVRDRRVIRHECALIRSG